MSMKKASWVRLGVVLGSVFAFACSGSSNSPEFGDGGTSGGGGGGPFGNLGGGGSTSSGGGSSTSGGITSGGSTSGGSTSGGSTSGGSTSGGSTSGGSSGGNLAACGMNSTGNTACDQCLVTNCCSQFHACAAEPQCKEVLNCAGACAQGDKTCVNSCEQQYPQGTPPAQAAANCWVQSCNTACPQ
jgi:hypothetical protein